MAAPNNVQRAVLKSMPGYRIIMQWTQGALMVAPNRHYQDAKVIDTDGQVYTFSHYMFIRDGRRNLSSGSTLSPAPKYGQSVHMNLPRTPALVPRVLSTLRAFFLRLSARALASPKR